MIKLAVMWISVYVTEIPHAIITLWNCCSARFRPDSKNWCFCASFNHLFLFTLLLEKPLITIPVMVGTHWQQGNGELVVLFHLINLCPWSPLHPFLVRLVKSSCLYEVLVGVVNTELNNSILNYIFNQSLKRPDRFQMGAQVGKDKKEISPPMHSWRRDDTWHSFRGYCLCSLSRMGKDRLAQSCPLSLSCPMLPSKLPCKRMSVSRVSAPLVHNLHFGQPCTNTSVQQNHTGIKTSGPPVHVSSKFTLFHFLVIRAMSVRVL